MITPADIIAHGLITLELPYPPSTNNLYFTVGRRRVLSNDGRIFKQFCAQIAFVAGAKPILDGEISVEIELYRPRRSGDVDNFSKALLDSLKGIAWRDDSQIKRIVVERFEDPKKPRAIVTITPIHAQNLRSGDSD